MWTVDIIAPGDDDGHLEGAVVALGQELRARLGGCVGIRRLQNLNKQQNEHFNQLDENQLACSSFIAA